MTVVVGIDGCPGGWVAARLTGAGVAWETAEVADVDALLPLGCIAGIDIPIGLLPRGRRACDDLARRELPGAAARVFSTPPRAVLERGPTAPNAEVQALCRELMGAGVSRQALHLADRILAVDATLARRTDVRVVEVHPELSFRELTGSVLASKHTPAGAAARREALSVWLPAADELLDRRPVRVPEVDAMDALAALWSAVRRLAGQARTLPEGATAPPFICV